LIPKNISIKKTILLLNALARLHNFCINELPIDDQEIPEELNVDTVNMMKDVEGYVSMDIVEGSEVRIPTALMDGGDHLNDISRNQRTTHERRNPDRQTPCYKLLQQVISKHMKRPLPMNNDWKQLLFFAKQPLPRLFNSLWIGMEFLRLIVVEQKN
jgi:hypothetical protein